MHKKIKTTINIDAQLWKRFSHIVIEEKGYRKKNEVIENLIRKYVEKKDSKENGIKRAIILAAGIGSRLRPLTNNIPLCLLKINSITILEHQIKNLEECEISDVIIVIGYKGEKIKQFCLEQLTDYNVDFKFVQNRYYSSTNNLYSLWLARKYFNKGFVCLNSDVFFDVSILKKLLKEKKDICAVVEKKECVEEDMKVKIGDGIEKIGKDLSREETDGEFIGVIKFSDRAVDKLLETFEKMPLDIKKRGYVSHLIQELINRGNKVHVVEIQNSFWKDIDFIEDLNEVRAYLLNNRR